MALQALQSSPSQGSSRAAGAWRDQAQVSLPFPQGSSLPNTAAGASATTTWSSGTCVTTGRGPSPSAGAATSTRVPSPRECPRGGTKSLIPLPGVSLTLSRPGGGAAGPASSGQEPRGTHPCAWDSLSRAAHTALCPWPALPSWPICAPWGFWVNFHSQKDDASFVLPLLAFFNRWGNRGPLWGHSFPLSDPKGP